MKNKILGIIGGMGAGATADLFQKIIALTDAKNDQEHIHVLIDNNTKIPDRSIYLLNKDETKSPKKYLINSAKKLESIGADILAIACNSSHYFIDDIRACITIPVINMVEETANEAAKMGLRCVGVLGTEGFVKAVNYKAFYDKLRIEIVIPTEEEQKHISRLIYKGIKSADYSINLSGFMNTLKRMSAYGVDAFALSCTELPLAFSYFNIDYPFLDSTKILAAKAIIEAGGRLSQ